MDSHAQPNLPIYNSCVNCLQDGIGRSFSIACNIRDVAKSEANTSQIIGLIMIACSLPNQSGCNIKTRVFMSVYIERTQDWIGLQL